MLSLRLLLLCCWCCCYCYCYYPLSLLPACLPAYATVKVVKKNEKLYLNIYILTFVPNKSRNATNTDAHARSHTHAQTNIFIFLSLAYLAEDILPWHNIAANECIENAHTHTDTDRDTLSSPSLNKLFADTFTWTEVLEN